MSLVLNVYCVVCAVGVGCGVVGVCVNGIVVGGVAHRSKCRTR